MATPSACSIQKVITLLVLLRGRDTNHSDEELIRLYKAEGRLDWLSTLYLRYTPLVYGVCLKYLKNRDEAQDAVMQIFERLVTALHQHKIERFRGWLYVLTRNHCLMELRDRNQKVASELTATLMENGLAEHPEEEILPGGDPGRLDRCLQGLAEPQKNCITLFYLQEKSYREISVTTGYDFNQVKSYIQNGKRNLKNCMEQG